MDRNWNCRLIEQNGERVNLPWETVPAYNPQRAARSYCSLSSVWDRAHWKEDDEGIVEVEEHGGENGVHRIAIRTYTALEFRELLARADRFEAALTEIRDLLPIEQDNYSRRVFSVAANALEPEKG